MRQKERLEKELKQLRADLEAQQLEIKALNTQWQRGNDEQQKIEQQLHEQKVNPYLDKIFNAYLGLTNYK